MSLADEVRFQDEEVLSEDFGDKVGEVVEVMAPFAHMSVVSKTGD